MAWTKLVDDNFGGFLYVSYSFSTNASARTWSCSAALKIEVPAYMAYGAWNNTSSHSGTLQANGMAYLDNLSGASAKDFTLVDSVTVGSGSYPLNGEAPSVSVSWAFNVNSSWAGYENEYGTVTLTGTALDPVTHTVHFCATNSNTEVAGHATKTCGQHLYVPTYSDGQFAFGGWKSNSAVGNFPASTIYTATSATSGGVEYTHDQNGGDIYLHWVPGAALGPSVILDANIYFNTDNNYLFPSTGAKASWTKFTSNAKYNDPPNEYQTAAKTYTPNSNFPGFSIRGTPYTHAGKFGVEFCGYYTGKDWTNPGIQVYAPKFDWLYHSNRNYAVVAVPNTEYFGSLQTYNTTEWNDSSNHIDFYTAAGDYYDENEEFEQISSDSLYVPKISSKVTSPPTGGLPAWLKTGSDTYTFYALWTKENLTFTYNPNGGTAQNSNNTQIIGKPGPATEEGATPSFKILTFAQTSIKPPTGYKFSSWNTSADGTGNTIAPNRTLKLGGYLNDVTLYAQYEQYHHTIILHANSYADGDNGPAFFPQLNGAKTVSGTYNGGDSSNNMNYRGQSWHPEGLKFLGYFTQNDTPVYLVNKNLECSIVYNNETYILNPAKAQNGDYFSEQVNNIGLPSVNDIEYTQKVQRASDTIGYKWAYTGTEAEVHLYAKWAPPTNAYINDNETWKPALIYINKNSSNPSLEPDWELIDMAEFLNNN